ncbi:MAG: ferredoxin reductase family protein [Alphaproteobacteria bacterium]|nr:ferredoxin reductase family protein [Alphaproteobacteria bacterium]
MRRTGIAVVFIALLIPLFWFVPLAAEHDPAAIASEYLGASALIAMAFSQLLVTRIPALQTVFGGQDRIYVQHKWLGIGAVAAVLLHESIDAEVSGLGGETALSEIAESLGEIGYYGLLALLAVTLLTLIPYHWWRWTHKLMGLVFSLAALHFAFIEKPFATLDPAGLYILAFCVIGVVSYLLTLIPYNRRYVRNRYRVTAIEPQGKALAVTLTPRGRGPRHRPGQFAFVQFDVPGCRETHPYTISKAPDPSGMLRFTIASLGDHTGKLPGILSAGTEAVVSAPLGRFTRKFGATREIWIAGGIGVTPFVAWAQSLQPGHAPIHFFYSARTRGAAPHLGELETIAKQDSDFHLHFVDSSAGKRLTPQFISHALDDDLIGAQAYFCGPIPMRNAIRSGLCRLGLRASAFHFEEFEIRSGIGLRRLFSWLAARHGSAGHPKGRPLRAV